MKVNKQKSPLENLKIIIEEAKRLDINFAKVTTPRIKRYLTAFIEGKNFKEIAELEGVTPKQVLNALCGENKSALSHLYMAVQKKNTASNENGKRFVAETTTTKKVPKRKIRKNDVDNEQKNKHRRKFTSLQMSLISLVDKHKENDLPLDTVLSEKELKILNLFLEGKAYYLIGEEVGLTPPVVSSILFVRNESIASKLRSNWHHQSLKNENRDDDRSIAYNKEGILLELKQCDRNLLNDALDNLQLTLLRNLFKSLTGWNKSDGKSELSKEEVLLRLKGCERGALNDVLDHLQLSHLKKLYKTISDWKMVDKIINLSKEEVFLELIQCDRKILNEALDSLSLPHLKNLYRSVRDSKS